MAILVFCAVVAIFTASIPTVASPTEEEPAYIESLNGVVEENTYHPVVAVERPSKTQMALVEPHIQDNTPENTGAAQASGLEQPAAIQEENATEPHADTRTADSAEAQTSEQTDAEASPLPNESPAPLWSTDDIIALCKTVIGEAGTKSPEQMAAVVWCVLNRVDDLAFPDNIADAATQAFQFQGYNWWNPIDPNVEKIVLDVLERWQSEKSGETDVGRILPREYLYFLGDGTVNHYTKSFGADEEWDWSLLSPYQAKNW